MSGPRIGVTGSAGVGKSRLVHDLAAATGLSSIEEEMRNRIVADGRGLSERGAAERLVVIGELWAHRQRRERELASFVADNCALDFTAYALFHSCLDEGRADHELVTGPARAIGSYDAVFVLPWGVLEYVRDGVRGESQTAQLTHQLLIEALLARHLPAERIHNVPRECRTPTQRLEFALDVLRGRALWAEPRSGEVVRGTSRPPARRPGRVFLVGAGPGTPELLTVRGRDLLARAQVVAFDRLIPPALLSLAPPAAELVDVGHRGRGNGEPAAPLHPEVLRHALAGRDVVRLKIGDPLIFGRGGEEARELGRAGVPFEIVPGISAALAAAAAAGIPLTQREVAGSVTLATGHDGAADLPGGSTGTLVLYMAARSLPRLVDGLLAKGHAASTPAAFVAAAACPEQRVVVSTLVCIADDASGVDRSLPGLVIVGDVVRLRGEVEWRSRLPLGQRRVLVGRARPGPSAIAERLRELGAAVIEAPVVGTLALSDPSGLDDALERVHGYNGLLFACAEGVRYCCERLLARGRDTRDLRGVRILALGAAAAQALAERGLHPAQASRGLCRDSFAADLCLERRGRYLGIGGAIGRRSLRRDMEALGAHVHWVGAYTNLYHFPRAGLGRVDLVVYPSSSVARLLLDGPLAETCRTATGLAIGERSRSSALQHGARHVLACQSDAVEEIVAEALRLLGGATDAQAERIEVPS
jgi:uroporphyrinogen III methyltransferase/synthase